MSPKQHRHELTAAQWERLQPVIPPQKRPMGRPSLDHRTTVNGILWTCKTGAPWRDMPERYGSWKTVSSRFYSWRAQGIWDKLWAEVQKDADTRDEIEWEIGFDWHSFPESA